MLSFPVIQPLCLLFLNIQKTYLFLLLKFPILVADLWYFQLRILCHLHNVDSWHNLQLIFLVLHGHIKNNSLNASQILVSLIVSCTAMPKMSLMSRFHLHGWSLPLSPKIPALPTILPKPLSHLKQQNYFIFCSRPEAFARLVF